MIRMIFKPGTQRSQRIRRDSQRNSTVCFLGTPICETLRLPSATSAYCFLSRYGEVAFKLPRPRGHFYRATVPVKA